MNHRGPLRINLTRRQVNCLRHALVLAIESLEGLIDAHRIEYAKNRRKGQVYKIIPAVYRPATRRWRNSIRDMRSLYVGLSVGKRKS
jgi:hypothetical protein